MVYLPNGVLYSNENELEPRPTSRFVFPFHRMVGKRSQTQKIAYYTFLLYKANNQAKQTGGQEGGCPCWGWG